MYHVIYNKDSGEIIRTLDYPSGFGYLVTLEDNEMSVTTDRMPSDVTEYVKDGEIVLKPTSDTELSEYKHLSEQELIWERIKERRLQAVTSGVYVESVDKWFHTDEVSSTTYSMIAGMIALDNYEPVQWKTMDNTWLLLTVPLFKALQTAISNKTNAVYALAEYHKASMLLADNPLEYDYTTGWDIKD